MNKSIAELDREWRAHVMKLIEEDIASDQPYVKNPDDLKDYYLNLAARMHTTQLHVVTVKQRNQAKYESIKRMYDYKPEPPAPVELPGDFVWDI
jgi:hypothetical protein